MFFCSKECHQAEQQIGGKLEIKHYGNDLRDKYKDCINCDIKLVNNQRKFCSLECNKEYKTNKKIELWLSGKWDGSYKNGKLSKIIHRYLLEQAKYLCEDCGQKDNWNNKPLSLHVHHKDGTWKNNSLENLKVLCPNCHTQTDNYGSKNNGNGRDYRYK